MSKVSFSVYERADSEARYFILDELTGDCYECSENPYHPGGFAKWSNNTADDYFCVTWGNSWRRSHDAQHVQKLIRFAVNRLKKYAEDDVRFLGKKVPFWSLPENVQLYMTNLRKNVEV